MTKKCYHVYFSIFIYLFIYFVVVCVCVRRGCIGLIIIGERAKRVSLSLIM